MNPKIKIACEQGAQAAKEYKRTGKGQRNPYRRESIECGWWDHGFRTEIAASGVKS